MTRLCVNKQHCTAAVRPSESTATTSSLPPAWVRICSVLLPGEKPWAGLPEGDESKKGDKRSPGRSGDETMFFLVIRDLTRQQREDTPRQCLLSLKTEVFISWVIGHSGVLGNQVADQLVGQGTHGTTLNINIDLPKSCPKKSQKVFP
ncbi:hypothetical protein AVEN_86029-1 [Araneus ventricosus]|uniref:RNase H type-1 domain-containing protein n=1 Tax=Araneus ventricosus TaxID=182803 RepID=A0A4Y2UKE8_ARAVE|nr:hypothetical protein AVEN_86029-1 [Araneus ventricosus]